MESKSSWEARGRSCLEKLGMDWVSEVGAVELGGEGGGSILRT